MRVIICISPEETEAQRWEGICPGSPSKYEKEASSSSSKVCVAFTFQVGNMPLWPCQAVVYLETWKEVLG